MTLEQIVCLARLRIEVAPNSVIDPGDVDIRIANAVRAFLGSELSQASAMQIGPSNEGHRIAIYFDDHKVAGKAFAALSSIGGE